MQKVFIQIYSVMSIYIDLNIWFYTKPYR